MFRAGALSRSNKRMHATRDTLLVINLKGVGGRVMRGVRLLLSCSPLPNECASAAGGETL